MCSGAGSRTAQEPELVPTNRDADSVVRLGTGGPLEKRQSDPKPSQQGGSSRPDDVAECDTATRCRRRQVQCHPGCIRRCRTVARPRPSPDRIRSASRRVRRHRLEIPSSAVRTLRRPRTDSCGACGACQRNVASDTTYPIGLQCRRTAFRFSARPVGVVRFQ